MKYIIFLFVLGLIFSPIVKPEKASMPEKAVIPSIVVQKPERAAKPEKAILIAPITPIKPIKPFN